MGKLHGLFSPGADDDYDKNNDDNNDKNDKTSDDDKGKYIMTKNIGSTSVHPWRRRGEPWRGSREAQQVRMIMIMEKRAFNVTVMVMLV